MEIKETPEFKTRGFLIFLVSGNYNLVSMLQVLIVIKISKNFGFNLFPVYYTLAKPTEKQKIITKVFSELSLFEDTLNYKCRNGFRVLEDKKSLICDPTGNRTPINGLRSRCPNRQTIGPRDEALLRYDGIIACIFASVNTRLSRPGGCGILSPRYFQQP